MDVIVDPSSAPFWLRDSEAHQTPKPHIHVIDSGHPVTGGHYVLLVIEPMLPGEGAKFRPLVCFHSTNVTESVPCPVGATLRVWWMIRCCLRTYQETVLSSTSTDGSVSPRERPRRVRP